MKNKKMNPKKFLKNMFLMAMAAVMFVTAVPVETKATGETGLLVVRVAKIVCKTHE